MSGPDDDKEEAEAKQKATGEDRGKKPESKQKELGGEPEKKRGDKPEPVEWPSKPAEGEVWKPKAGRRAEELAEQKIKATQGWLPDVSKTPAPPAGPVPIPYPATGGKLNEDSGEKTKSVPVTGKSEFKKSIGDEPSTLKGIKSGTVSGKTYSKARALDVKMEGKSARRSELAAHELTHVVQQKPAGKPEEARAEYLKYPKESKAVEEAKDKKSAGESKDEAAAESKGRKTQAGKKVMVASRKRKLKAPLDAHTLDGLSGRIHEKLKRQSADERDATGAD